MKTRGFTLVELLAVIVILAVLALIATPVVLSIIDDAKESAMLRSAEMYLSGVENAVMRENMNSGGNFRPNECTITNGNMTCGTTNVEVEVDGEVPSTGTIVFENGKIKEVTLNYQSGTIVKDSSGNLVYEGSKSAGQKVALAPKKENYTVGEEVTIGAETFYVIADDTEKVILLAKDNIDTTNLVQSASASPVDFSTTNYWSNATEDSVNLNDYPIAEGVTTPALTKAKEYGIKVGGTGRLMTINEAYELETSNYDILFGYNEKSSSDYLDYWLGSANKNGQFAFYVCGGGAGDLLQHYHINLGFNFGVRPVVEISKSDIY